MITRIQLNVLTISTQGGQEVAVKTGPMRKLSGRSVHQASLRLIVQNYYSRKRGSKESWGEKGEVKKKKERNPSSSNNNKR